MRALITIAVLAVVASASCFAQKATVDPNAPRPAAAVRPAAQADRYDPAKDPDKRMAQKVSYEALHQRLSAVVAGISSLTGVGIACGDSSKDWQVRDIPVTVYAKDLPLGVLLRGLARATHNVLRVVKTDSSYAYRIHQDPRMAKQFADYYTLKHAYESALGPWEWDAMVALKDMPDAPLKQMGEDPTEAAAELNAMKKLSALMTVLGPEYKQRALVGDGLALDIAHVPAQFASPLRAFLTACDQAVLARHRLGVRVDPRLRIVPLSQEELDGTVAYIHFDGGLAAGVSEPIGWGDDLTPAHHYKADRSREVFGTAPTQPPRIEDNPLWNTDYHGFLYDIPDLNVKLDVSGWGQGRKMGTTDVIVEAAKQTGYSVVLEDWVALRRSSSEILGSNIGEAKYKQAGALIEQGLRAWVNTRDRLIVDIDWEWVDEHLGLIPASVRDSLVQKLGGEGVDFDDILPVLTFTPMQWRESVTMCSDLRVLAEHLPSPVNALWQFYAGLSAEDKASAATDAGLSLGKFEPGYMAVVLKRACEPQHVSVSSTPGLDMPSKLALHLSKQTTDLRALYAAHVPGMISGQRSMEDARLAQIPISRAIPSGLAVYSTYSLYISPSGGTKKGQLLSISGPQELPFCSGSRRAALLKELFAPPKAK